ncbi:hypothetical protein LWC35_18240 [Pseudonocardia kujensis]|uniref:hypothetical protein n=1 Tax=Pseudonocardia kujensis TaxID=1128675 RepID=UPI001E476067|nr:hypothetical protein [Pseudonocardia kujensis]MCE0764831.1 hypothetical protein [Pseudonocardia kujensis]
MTTNTAHAACSHPTTKSARAKCRRTNGKAYAASILARSIASKPSAIIEPCSCRGPVEDNMCTLCDRPVPALVAA